MADFGEKNLCRNITTKVSNGTAYPLGAAVTGCPSISTMGDGAQCVFMCRNMSANQWEEFVGTYTASNNRVTRNTLISSSTGSAIAWAAGEKEIYPTNTSVGRRLTGTTNQIDANDDPATGRRVVSLASAVTTKLNNVLTPDTDTSLAANSDSRVATQKAIKTYVDAAVVGLLDFKGAYDCSSNPLYPLSNKSDAYVVSHAGKIGGASGPAVDVGDVFISKADTAEGDHASVGASWFIIEHNIIAIPSNDIEEDGWRLRWEVTEDSLGTHIYPDVVMLDEPVSYASEIAIDLTRLNGDRITVTLTGDATVNVSNYSLGDPARPGKLFRLVITQDATGGRAIDWDGSPQTWLFHDGEPALDTRPNAVSELEFLVTSVDPVEFTFVRPIHSPRRTDITLNPTDWTWTIRTAASNNNWKSVCYGNGLFVAVSWNGTGNRVMTSPDGITWTSRTSAADNTWEAVCYGNGLFVAVSSTGTGNRVMTSPDGITWTSRTSAADKSWSSVCYGNGLFVAVSSSGTGTTDEVMTSPDGITWTGRNASFGTTWFAVIYANGLFVAVGSGAVSGDVKGVMTSPDGITWTTRNAPNRNPWVSITYGNGLFVAVAYQNSNGANLMTSTDGLTWTIGTPAAEIGWRSITYGNGVFVAVSDPVGSDPGDYVMWSPNGINWFLEASPLAAMKTIAFGGNLFVAVCSASTNGQTSSKRVMTTSAPTFQSLDWSREINHVTLGAGSGPFVLKLGDVLPHETIRLAVSNPASTGSLVLLDADFGDAGSPTLPATGKIDLLSLTAISLTTVAGATVQTGVSV